MKILDLCEKERPREKLLSKGPGALGDGELLAILIRSGKQGENAVDIAQRLLSQYGGRLSQLASLSAERLASVDGIGLGKACSIAAAFELGRRFMLEDSGLEKVPVVTASQVYSIMIPSMKGLEHEECWVLLLNNAGYVLSRKRVTVGGDDSTVIDVKQIARMAISEGASGVILVHNHPTGNPNPSSADVRETESLKKACGICSIRLLDHVVVCDDSYYSFAEERMVHTAAGKSVLRKP